MAEHPLQADDVAAVAEPLGRVAVPEQVGIDALCDAGVLSGDPDDLAGARLR